MFLEQFSLCKLASVNSKFKTFSDCICMQIKTNGYTFRGSNATYFYVAPFLIVVSLEGKNLLLMEHPLTLLHSERPKLYPILAFLSAIGLNKRLSHLRRVFTHSKAKKKSLKLFPFCKK